MTKNELKADLAKAYNQQANQRNKSELEDWKAMERAHFLLFLQKEAIAMESLCKQ